MERFDGSEAWLRFWAFSWPSRDFARVASFFCLSGEWEKELQDSGCGNL